jgi:hypothetical protein
MGLATVHRSGSQICPTRAVGHPTYRAGIAKSARVAGAYRFCGGALTCRPVLHAGLACRSGMSGSEPDPYQIHGLWGRAVTHGKPAASGLIASCRSTSEAESRSWQCGVSIWVTTSIYEPGRSRTLVDCFA